MSNLSLRHHPIADAVRYRGLPTDALRDAFLLRDLFEPDSIRLVHAPELDRMIAGTVVPVDDTLTLTGPDQLRCERFCERRELGVINLGGAGRVATDSGEFDLAKHDTLYLGRGSGHPRFSSERAADPARFYLVSFPAHAEHPTTLVRSSDANRLDLGSAESANRRTIYQAIYPGGAGSSQLVMGWTELAPGSVWNTMPPHTHLRRCEAYLYFDLEPGQRVMHLMGEPEATRPLWVDDWQAALSPPWSIHCGVGTGAYSFVWAMGGENQRFDDMDSVALGELK